MLAGWWTAPSLHEEQYEEKLQSSQHWELQLTGKGIAIACRSQKTSIGIMLDIIPVFGDCAIRTFENSKKMSCANCTRGTHKNPCETTISSHPWPNSPNTLLPSKLQLIWCQDQSWHQAAIKIHKGTTREQQLATPSESHLTQHPPVAADHWHIHLVGSSVHKAEESTWEMVCLPWQEKMVNKWHWFWVILKVSRV